MNSVTRWRRDFLKNVNAMTVKLRVHTVDRWHSNFNCFKLNQVYSVMEHSFRWKMNSTAPGVKIRAVSWHTELAGAFFFVAQKKKGSSCIIVTHIPERASATRRAVIHDVSEWRKQQHPKKKSNKSQIERSSSPTYSSFFVKRAYSYF